MRQARILIAEDDFIMQKAMRRLLERHGYEVVFVKDGLEFLELLAKQAEFDVYISDIDMPHLDGIGLVEQLRREFPLVVDRLIIHSGRSYLPEYIKDVPFVNKGDINSLLQKILQVIPHENSTHLS